MNKDYTLIFIFDKSLENVLLINKKEGLFSGKLNGLGGRIKEGENSGLAALRKVEEQVNMTIDDMHLFSEPISICETNTVIISCIVLKNPDYHLKIDNDDGQISWFNIKSNELVDLKNKSLAPHTAYLIYYCLTYLSNYKEEFKLCQKE
jgi:8-oxo-dGTP pyrophosphatase MutT (NUDIX family)